MTGYDPTGLHTLPEKTRGAHLLLAASRLVRRLSELARKRNRKRVIAAEEEATDPALWLDEQVGLWAGQERAGDLTGQESVLFRCLYTQAGQQVTRKRLFEGTFGKDELYTGREEQDSRLNTVMQRLR